MAGRIVVFGATGYTGRLVVQALVARGQRPLLASRSAGKLERLAADYDGLQTAHADVNQPETVRGLVERGDVLVTTVGPFSRYGEAAAIAAVDAGAHYVDSTGEAGFVRRIFGEWGPRAEQAGCALLTAFGYDYVPGNLAGGLAAREGGDAARRVEVGYFASGGSAGMSSGTRATVALAATDPAHLLDGGRLIEEPSFRRVRDFGAPGKPRSAGLVGGTEALALPRTFPELTDVVAYLGWFGPATKALQAASYATPTIDKVPAIGRALRSGSDKLAAKTGEGPDATARAEARMSAVGIASDAGGRELARVRIAGRDMYGFTAATMAWAAGKLVAGEASESGALGPVDAFGLDALQAACAEAGLTEAS
jgi:short subunit dehydrogenase-like uncharacterized protein